MPTPNAHSCRRPRSLAALLLGLVLLLPTSSQAQTLVGTVLEEGRNTPVAGATVSLVDQGGEPRAVVTSDSLGRFQLTPPEVGDYVVEAVALGYAATTSPLFAMTLDGNVPFDLMLRPNPIGLTGLEVEVEAVDLIADELLGQFGLSPAELGRRWITHADIEKMPSAISPLQAIRWRGIPGVQLAPQGAGPPSLCIIFRQRGCALTVLNGLEISPGEAGQLNPLDLEAITVLTPLEATMFYGTRAANGVVLMWTRRGGR